MAKGISALYRLRGCGSQPAFTAELPADKHPSHLLPTSRQKLAGCFHVDTGEQHPGLLNIEQPPEEFRNLYRVQALRTRSRSWEDLVNKCNLAKARSAGGVLLVSGDASDGRGKDSVTALRDLRREMHHGAVPNDLALLAAANPVAGKVEAERVERKLEAGADSIVTQPPLLPAAWDAWASEMERRDLFRGFALIVGAACITSERSARWWLGLCGLEDPDDLAVREALQPKSSIDADELGRQSLLRAVHAASECSAFGVHVMPITKHGFGVADSFLWEYSLSAPSATSD